MTAETPYFTSDNTGSGVLSPTIISCAVFLWHLSTLLELEAAAHISPKSVCSLWSGFSTSHFLVDLWKCFRPDVLPIDGWRGFFRAVFRHWKKKFRIYMACFQIYSRTFFSFYEDIWTTYVFDPQLYSLNYGGSIFIFWHQGSINQIFCFCHTVNVVFLNMEDAVISVDINMTLAAQCITKQC